MPAALPIRIVRGRPRLVIAALCGFASWLAMPGALAARTQAIAAWDVGCLSFLLLCASKFTFERDADLAADAAAQQEGEWTIFWLTVGAVAASFTAILGEFSATKDMPESWRGLHVALVAVTLLVSWLMTHTVFALRYAHEYYAMQPGVIRVDGGLIFPGDDPPDYWDFVYFSMVLGMTFQVSDVQISSRKLRRLAVAHGFLSFLFNTVIVALSVNIGASLL